MKTILLATSAFLVAAAAPAFAQDATPAREEIEVR